MDMKRYFFLLFLLGFPLITIGQDMVDLQKRIVKAKNPVFDDEFEGGLYLATKLIMENHRLRGSREYGAAEKIVAFWKDKEKWFTLPLESKFQQSLQSDYVWSFINEVAQINYILNQKNFKNRTLKCTSVKEKKEVQLEAAKMVLKYSIDNKVNLPEAAQKYVEAYNNNKLEKIFFKK